jgi:hypothetical protein
MAKELPPFEFGIMRILDCGFMIEELISPEPGKIKIGYGMNFLFDVPANWIQFLIKVNFQDSDTGNEFLTGTVLTRFSVNNLAGFVDENDKVIFPNGSLETLFGIAFSHLRAILSKNVMGSRFSHIIVPIIHPGSLFNQLLQLNADKFREMKSKEDGKFVKNEQIIRSSQKKRPGSKKAN